jgi:glycerol kinase
MQENYILSIDLGTTNITALLVSFSDPKTPKTICSSQSSAQLISTKENWLEHNLETFWKITLKTIKELMIQAESTVKNFSSKYIQAIGITNQRESLCFFERKTHKGLKAISWQCKRSLAMCKSEHLQKQAKSIYKKTGLRLDPYFTGSKILWSIQNIPNLKNKLLKQEILLGTIDTYIIYRLTDGLSYVSEPSNASRTLLYNLHTKSWDPDLKELMGLTKSTPLADILDSTAEFGSTRNLHNILPDGIKIKAVLGDQQAALAGQLCVEEKMGKCTYGTGAFLLVNTGNKIIQSSQDLLTTVAWSHRGKYTYALEAAAFIAGSAVNFLKQNLGIIKDNCELSLNSSIHAAPEIYFVPALLGLGSPWWEADIRGSIFGLSLQTTKNQIILATLEGIALQVEDLLATIKKSNIEISELHVDGGVSKNDTLIKFQTFISQINIRRAQNTEATALGIAYITALSCNIYKNISDLKNINKNSTVFAKNLSNRTSSQRNAILAGWKRAIIASRDFYKKI